MSNESRFLVVILTMLCGIGLVMIFSATAIIAAESSSHGSLYYFLLKQLIWMGVAGCIAIGASRIPYQFWQKYAFYIFLFSIILLVLVLIPSIGARLNGARRWFRFGPLSFQPSELAKYTLLLFLAAYLSKEKDLIKKFVKGILPCFVAIGLTCCLIIFEPDVGTSLFIAMITFTVLIVAGARFMHILPFFGGGLLLVTTFVILKSDYIMKRIAVYMDPSIASSGKGYQTIQSLIALGSGGAWGKGPGMGESSHYFLPEVHSDFIFAVIGEELGFVGAISIIALFLAFLFVCWRICMKTDNMFAFLLSIGITMYISVQAILNIAVVTASIPTKGISLPFISFGGSSLILTMFAIGLMINISNSTLKQEHIIPQDFPPTKIAITT